MKLGEMLLAPARVWPARMEQRHLLVAPLTYIKKPEVCVAKATVKWDSHTCTAGLGKGKRRKRRKVLGRRKGVGEVESV